MKTVFVISTVCLFLAGCVTSEHYVYEQRHSIQTYRTAPVYVQPVCTWDYEPIYQTYQYVDHADHGSVIAGTILGGAIGNQFGSGSGRTAATIAGAMLGGSIASQPRVRTEHSIVGYDRVRICH